MFLHKLFQLTLTFALFSAGICVCNASDRSISSDKLMLHYNFAPQYIANGKLTDLSGNGHHGQMRGNFTVCKNQDLAGALFNGQDTAIIPYRAKDLRLNGAFSVALKIRITPEQAHAMRNSSPFIFGTPDNRSIMRNYAMLFDYGSRLELDVGNGIDNYNAFNTYDLADGQLHNVVYVVAPPMAWIYIDGECAKQTNSASVTPTTNAGTADTIIGCWRPGRNHFLGELYELRLYNRALSFREVLSFSNQSTDVTAEADLVLNYSAVRNAVDWDIYARNLPECDGSLELTVNGQSIAQTDFKKEQFIAERLNLSGFSNLPQLPPGKYEAGFAFKNIHGKVLLKHKHTFAVEELTETARFDNTIGISEEVLPPWTPVQYKQNSDGSLEVAVWNRRYTFYKNFMAFDFKSGGESLMTAPGELNVFLKNGKKEIIKPLRLKVVKASPHQIIIKQSAKSKSFLFEVTHCIEYDGFDRINLQITPRKSITVKELFFQLPVSPKHAKYSVPRGLEPEKIQGKQVYPFTPVYYLGDEYKGLHFIADSDEHYYPYDHKRVMTVEPQSKQILWSLRFIDEAISINSPVKYEFALQATPVRPVMLDAWERRVVVMAPYCGELQLLTMQRNGVPAIEDYARLGAKAFSVMRVEKPFAYPTIPGSEFANLMRPVTQRAHELGISMYPYAVSFVFSQLAPEWNERELYLLYPHKSYTDYGDTLERESGVKQNAYHVCNNPYYQNLMLYRVQNAMQYEHVDGVYLDGTTSTRRCENSRHGCGYLRADGKYQGTYCGFATRDMLKRLYTLIWQLRGEKGGVDLHMSDSYHISAAAYATTRWMGESLPKRNLITQSLSLEDYRLLYTGGNIGSPVDLLSYTMRQHFRTALALSLLHNMPARPHANIRDIAEIAEVWAVRDKFNCTDAEFIAYWEEHVPLKTSDADVYVSIHVRKDGHALAVVSNLSGQQKKIQLLHTPAAQKHWVLPSELEIPAQDFIFTELVPQTGK